MELLTATGIQELEKFKDLLLATPAEIEFEGSQILVPYSSETSRSIRNQLIKFCQELITNNNTSYWLIEGNKDKALAFITLFDGDMGNYAPACFDQLSTKIAKLYLALLDVVKNDKMLSSAAKALINTRSLGTFNKLLSFVKSNTRHLINLFELVAKQKLFAQSQLPEENMAHELIKAADTLINYIKLGKPCEQLERASLAYKTLTTSEASLPEALNAKAVITQYTNAVNPLVSTLLAADIPMIGFAGLDGETTTRNEHLSKIIGTKAIAMTCKDGYFYNPFINLEVCRMKEFRLKALTADEHFLLKNAKSISEDVNISSNEGFLQQLRSQFSPEKYRQNIIALGAKAQNIIVELEGYLKGGHLTFFSSINPEKAALANEIITTYRKLIADKYDDRHQRLFFSDYLGKMLITMLQQDAQHAQIVRGSAHTSYGSLGALLAQFIDDLYGFMNEIDLSCSPSVFYEFLTRDEQKQLHADIRPSKSAVSTVENA